MKSCSLRLPGLWPQMPPQPLGLWPTTYAQFLRETSKPVDFSSDQISSLFHHFFIRPDFITFSSLVHHFFITFGDAKSGGCLSWNLEFITFSSDQISLLFHQFFISSWLEMLSKTVSKKVSGWKCYQKPFPKGFLAGKSLNSRSCLRYVLILLFL